MFSNIPDHILIRAANNAKKSLIDWSGAEVLIDNEFERRYEEIKEELEEFEVFETSGLSQ